MKEGLQQWKCSTGSASGGLSIALAASGHTYLQQAISLGIDPQVLHRVAAMAGAGLDTLPHNGAILTILAITGVTHRQAYREIFGLTVIKVAAPFFVILVYTWFGIV
ncbi:hypothetical protein ACTID9_22610 [Brevibacillus fluminis]|uniref:hypothetical protein n=1 Tax=Brevibacillus fluminis TaxID=511487 RepID=UPI003F898E3A